MVFSSSIFIFLFLPLTLGGYFLIRTDLRNVFLLIMSLLFYAWGEPIYVFLMLGSIMMNYVGGLLIERQRRKQTKIITEKTILALCIAGNLGLLLYFKYANFFINNLNAVLQYLTFDPITHPHVSLPIGISFFTFQAMSYVIDVYRKEADVLKNPLNCGLYVSMFPQLIAGPIVRYHDVARQIISRTISRSQYASGIQRFIFGLAKKVIIANPLGEVADQIFAIPSNELTTGLAWLGLICYTLQIYYDFSGYSDMAIGLGRMFGFEFLENFNYPYISRSIREFWRRWHISLSTWFRDYLYIPLGGNRIGPRRTYFNLWIVFLLCGLWHGASWNFVIWGTLHGVYLVIERLGWEKTLMRLWPPLRYGYTLLLVMIGWVFFRAETLTQSVHYLASMVGLTPADGTVYYASLYLDPMTVMTLLVGCVFAAPLAPWLGRWMQERTRRSPVRLWQPTLNAGYYVILMMLFLLSATYIAAGTYNPFIYFRF